MKYSKTIRPRKEIAQKLSILEHFALKNCLFEAVYISNIARLVGKVKLWILADDGAARRTGGGLANEWRTARQNASRQGRKSLL